MGNWYDDIQCHENNSYPLSASDAVLFIRHPFDEITKVFFQPITCIIGSLLNISFLFVVFRLKIMQTITNAYLVNLAISDLICLISNTVIDTMQYVISPIATDFGFLGTTGCVLVLLPLLSFIDVRGDYCRFGKIRSDMLPVDSPPNSW